LKISSILSAFHRSQPSTYAARCISRNSDGAMPKRRSKAAPSRADEVLTNALKQALALVDVKVLDHFIVGANRAMSFAERGLI